MARKKPTWREKLLDDKGHPTVAPVCGPMTKRWGEGLMVIPPFRENPEEMRPYFRALRGLQADLMALHIPNVDLRELSMGMTHDYQVAIEEGATLVRIGTAIFGSRSA